MYSNYTFQHLDITLDTDCHENDLFQIVQKLRPEWKQSDITIEKKSGGYLNQVYSCLHNDDLVLQEDGLLVRMNGKNRKAMERVFIHKQHEIRYVKEMNAHKIGAPLLATFNNGLILKLMKGKTLSPEELQNQDIERKVAKMLAQIHLITIPSDIPKCWELKEGLLRCMGELDQDSNLEERYKELYTSTIRKEFDCMVQWIESCNIPIELNHGDCSPANLIYDEQTGLMTILDFEIASTQIFTYDLGKYHLSLLGVPRDFRKYDGERMKQFVKLYLEEKYKLLQKPLGDLTEDIIEQVGN